MERCGVVQCGRWADMSHRANTDGTFAVGNPGRRLALKECAMSGYFHRIAASLGVTKEQLSNYCNTLRAAGLSGLAPSNRDIAQMLQELVPANPDLAHALHEFGSSGVAPIEIGNHAKRIAAALRARNRGSGTSRIDRLRVIGKRPTSHVRCSCGAPAIPGSDRCYTCSS